MNKFYLSFIAIVAMLCTSVSTKAVGWPANYEGVMLQGFYWDSNNETSWTKLTASADELSTYFKLIWVPNSAKAEGSPSMGYHPIYWFSNHNSSFGSQAQLKTMISTFKEKGTGIIEDVVLNHRSGVSNWYNFPSETWNGKTYQLTDGAICAGDEMWSSTSSAAKCPYKPGANDTGENWDGSRDLDHTNATVQSHIKDYCKFLLTDLGYVGFRLDFVKGYGGQFTKIYNQYAKPQFCVGEYFDGSYDACAAWIESTGKESAAFDFPFKFAVNDAFGSNDMTKLSWKANGTTDQPAGLIHFGYPQFAVTFIDNHDTYRDHNKFNGNVVAANAFMLCSPGTPCVFWKHYTDNKAAIQALIKARNSVGIHNMSKVEVMQLSRDCYMAKVTGTKGSLIVKIGSAQVSAPSGYTMAASGTNYCVWTSKEGGNDNPGTPFKVYFDNTGSRWSTPHIHYWGASESTWPGVAMTKHKDNVWVYTVPAGTTGCLFNAGDGDATKTGDFVAQADHIYTTSGDAGLYDDYTTNPTTPFDIYFDNGPSNWTSPYIHYWGASESTWPGVAMAKFKGNIWKYTVPAGTTGCLFNAGDGDATKTSDFVAKADHLYTTSGDQGKYAEAGLADIEADNDAPVEYFNLQGIRVDEPSNGVFIRRQGNSVTKVFVK